MCPSATVPSSTARPSATASSLAGATVLDGAVIGNDCLIGAGALVTGKMNAPDGSLIVGSPAKVVRELTEKEKESILANAALYLEKSKEYRAHAAKQA